MAPSNRRVFSQASQSSVRTVTLSSGGLNERFSQLDTTRQSTSSPSNRPSIFSRIRGGSDMASGRGPRSDIQSRLGRTNAGGVNKRSRQGPAPMTGVQRTGGGPLRNQRGKISSSRLNNRQQKTRSPKPGKGAASSSSARGGKRADGRGKSKDKKPATAEDLDKALDEYMMKDPKTAQSKLDAELSAYMDEAGDILMEL
ncbi:uncharacterized protein BYT42DRAFT_53312 [Radiomyces spectabilis]|uniref:uncharacterized protein n=1 Tax=Radiomyces spectabilis TaxID=64574 RepID=UPI00221F00D9|nr:uncharacterized protein BYT42DRAFT_53312 [Radiomyces spectabilis]KAI8372956.1 hypothetical protein BYT42DRAFT_53312 [Radiomyces spectabilis]